MEWLYVLFKWYKVTLGHLWAQNKNYRFGNWQLWIWRGPFSFPGVGTSSRLFLQYFREFNSYSYFGHLTSPRNLCLCQQSIKRYKKGQFWPLIFCAVFFKKTDQFNSTPIWRYIHKMRWYKKYFKGTLEENNSESLSFKCELCSWKTEETRPEVNVEKIMDPSEYRNWL